MRADSDHAVGNSVDSCKDESRPYKRPEEICEDAELKVLKNGKKKNNVCELFYDTRSGDECDKENDRNNTLGRHSCEDYDVAGKKIGGKSHDTAVNGGLFYMDKNITACDLPEIVVCYKGSTYHAVKDICVDEGVPVHEKFLFGEKDSVRCNSNQCESEVLVEAGKGNENALEPKFSEDRNGMVNGSELCNYPKTNQDVEPSSREDFAGAEGSSYCNQEHLNLTRASKVESNDNSKDEVATLENVLTLGGILSREDEQKPLNNNCHIREEQSLSQLQENEQISLETTALETEEPKKAEETLSSVSTTTSQEPNILGESFEDEELFSNGFGETSFSAAEAVSISGHISYSGGPVALSGRLSVRSDASTTSGRSFAFPILQSELNSSPERMAKAEKRRLKTWRDILLCCRFS